MKTKTPLQKTAALFSVLVAVVALLTCQPVDAALDPSRTITFDDLPVSYVGGDLPSTYAGLNWSGRVYYWNISPSGYWSWAGGTAVSLPHVGVLSGPMNTPECSFSSAQPFTLKSAYLSQAYPQLGGRRVTVRGYQGGTSLYEQVITPPVRQATLFTFDWVGIDKVEFAMGAADMSFIMDNLTIFPVVDVAATSLKRDAAQDGFNYKYKIDGDDLTVPLNVAFYWAKGPTLNDSPKLANQTPITLSGADVTATTHTKPFPRSALTAQPADATHLLLVVDPPDATHSTGVQRGQQCVCAPAWLPR